MKQEQNLLAYSIIPRDALRTNPRNIPYHNPNFPIVKYSKMVCEYFFWREVQTAEDMAKMMGRVLVPSRCMTWKRKKQKADCCITIGGRTFYALRPDDMTKLEKERYLAYVESISVEHKRGV